MMAILGTIFIGLIVGFIARAVKPGDDKLGWIMTAVLCWAWRGRSWPATQVRRLVFTSPGKSQVSLPLL